MDFDGARTCSYGMDDMDDMDHDGFDIDADNDD